jgi:hypothetical protein
MQVNSNWPHRMSSLKACGNITCQQPRSPCPMRAQTAIWRRRNSHLSDTQYSQSCNSSRRGFIKTRSFLCTSSVLVSVKQSPIVIAIMPLETSINTHDRTLLDYLMRLLEAIVRKDILRFRSKSNIEEQQFNLSLLSLDG